MGSPVPTLTLDDVNVTAPAPTVQSTATAPAPAPQSSPGVADQLTIQTGGQTLEGWLTSSVIRGVERTPSDFTISLTERFPHSDLMAIVVPGSTCTVSLGSTQILQGYIDDYSPRYDARTHNVVISGSSNTEDVVDSSYFSTQAGAWAINAGQSLKTVVTNILSQQTPNVGLTMSDADDVVIPFPYHINPGESVYSVIETLCRMCSRLVWDDASGNLVISQVGTTRAGSSLVEGQNVEVGAVKINWRERFNKLIVMSAGQEPGGLNVPVQATATDSQVRTSRTKVVLMDMFPGPGGQFAQQRANWEMNRRIGRSLMTQVTVTGWRDGAGNVWTPNTIVHAQLPTLKINADLVISECDWLRDDGGTRTVLTCMPASALQPQPYIPVAGTGEAITQ